MEDLASLLAWALSRPSDLPQRLQGPTGREFDTPSGMKATELVETAQTPEGKWQNYPLLVPGQVNIASLLAGQEPTDEQRQYAQLFSHASPLFDLLASALESENKRHAKLDKLN